MPSFADVRIEQRTVSRVPNVVMQRQGESDAPLALPRIHDSLANPGDVQSLQIAAKLAIAPGKEADVQRQPDTQPSNAAEHFIFAFSGEDFVISFELSGDQAAAGGKIRASIVPRNISSATQDKLEYFDVNGRPVTKDDDYATVANVGDAARPHVRDIVIANNAMFAVALLSRSSSPENGDVCSFDLNGDGKPDYAVRVQHNENEISRNFSIKSFDNKKAEHVEYYYKQPDAWKYMRGGSIRPVPKDKKFVEILGEVLRLPFDIAIGMVPVLGDVVDAMEALNGVTKWGEKLSTTERIVTALAIVIPLAGGAVLRKMLRGGAALAEAAAKLGRSEDEMMAILTAIEKNGGKGTNELALWTKTLQSGGKLSNAQLHSLDDLLRKIDVDVKAEKAIQSGNIDVSPTKGTKHERKPDENEIPVHTSARLGEPSAADLKRIRKGYPGADSVSEQRAVWMAEEMASTKGMVAGERQCAALLGVPPGENMVDLVKINRNNLKVPVEVKNQRVIHLAGDGNAAFNKFKAIAKHSNMENISHFEVVAHSNSKLPANFRVTKDGTLEQMVSGTDQWKQVMFGGKGVKIRRGELGRISVD